MFIIGSEFAIPVSFLSIIISLMILAVSSGFVSRYNFDVKNGNPLKKKRIISIIIFTGILGVSILVFSSIIIFCSIVKGRDLVQQRINELGGNTSSSRYYEEYSEDFSPDTIYQMALEMKKENSSDFTNMVYKISSEQENNISCSGYISTEICNQIKSNNRLNSEQKEILYKYNKDISI